MIGFLSMCGQLTGGPADQNLSSVFGLLSWWQGSAPSFSLVATDPLQRAGTSMTSAH